MVVVNALLALLCGRKLLGQALRFRGLLRARSRSMADGSRDRFSCRFMQALAAITVEAVGLVNIPAVQHGISSKSAPGWWA